MSYTGDTVGADLGGVLGADEELFRDAIWPFLFSEMLGDEFGVVKAAGANVAVDGGERDDNGWFVLWRKEFVHEFCKRVCQGTNRMIFVIVDNVAKKTGAFAYDVGGWKIGAIWAFSGLGEILAMWANGLMMVFDVFFTTIA